MQTPGFLGQKAIDQHTPWQNSKICEVGFDTVKTSPKIEQNTNPKHDAEYSKRSQVDGNGV
jgi:hypothetical protein